ncbi:MAG: molybdopterin-binding protein [Anaerolineae bacterium]|nr:molybdopterin-binding protein [Candidatus Roseilinea sp.]MDW8450903.1 molybdopterin-binding protein [Anaerolineae bacterium]
MKFGPISLDCAEGKILGHNIAGPDGQRLLRKGKALTPADVAALRAMGHRSVYVAELEPGDIGEDDAAREVAALVMGEGLLTSFAGGGRMNLLAARLGVVRVDVERLNCINEIEGLTIATMANHAAVAAKQMAATIKIIPFAVPASAIEAARRICEARSGAIIRVDGLPTRRVVMILSGMPSVRERVMSDFEPAMRARIEALGSQLAAVDYVPLESEDDEHNLAQALLRHAEAGAQLIVLAGETAIMDRRDIVPRAIERAHGEVTCFGAPVDPGNLLMVAYLGDLPILGAPGCARSRKVNVVDWVLPRLLAGDRLTRKDITTLGVGGLLEEISERPRPRAAKLS